MVHAGAVTALLPISSLPQKINAWVNMVSVMCPSAMLMNRALDPPEQGWSLTLISMRDIRF